MEHTGGRGQRLPVRGRDSSAGRSDAHMPGKRRHNKDGAFAACSHGRTRRCVAVVVNRVLRKRERGGCSRPAPRRPRACVETRARLRRAGECAAQDSHTKAARAMAEHRRHRRALPHLAFRRLLAAALRPGKAAGAAVREKNQQIQNALASGAAANVPLASALHRTTGAPRSLTAPLCPPAPHTYHHTAGRLVRPRCAQRHDVPDVATLRRLALSRGGLLSSSLRLRAWPHLLRVYRHSIPSFGGESPSLCCPPRRGSVQPAAEPRTTATTAAAAAVLLAARELPAG